LHQVGDLFELNVKLRCQTLRKQIFAISLFIYLRLFKSYYYEYKWSIVGREQFVCVACYRNVYSGSAKEVLLQTPWCFGRLKQVLIIVITPDRLQGENVTMKCINRKIDIYLILTCYEINTSYWWPINIY